MKRFFIMFSVFVLIVIYLCSSVQAISFYTFDSGLIGMYNSLYYYVEGFDDEELGEYYEYDVFSTYGRETRGFYFPLDMQEQTKWVLFFNPSSHSLFYYHVVSNNCDSMYLNHTDWYR